MHLLRCLVGSAAECWEGRMGFILFPGWGRGVIGPVTLYQADLVTSGFCVPKPWLPHLTLFCHSFPRC